MVPVSGFYIHDHGDKPFRGVTSTVKLVAVFGFYVHAYGDELFKGVTPIVEHSCPSFSVRCLSCELHSIIQVHRSGSRTTAMNLGCHML